MCTLVTVGVALQSADRTLETLRQKFSRSLRVHDNPHLKGQLPSGRQIFCTSGHCDCGTVIGSVKFEEDATDYSKSVGRLRKKGWSDARIDRWFKEKAANHQADQQRSHDEYERSLEWWTEFLRFACTETASPVVGLLHHFYSGGYDDEEFSVSTRRAQPLSALTHE